MAFDGSTPHADGSLLARKTRTKSQAVDITPVTANQRARLEVLSAQIKSDPVANFLFIRAHQFDRSAKLFQSDDIALRTTARRVIDDFERILSLSNGLRNDNPKLGRELFFIADGITLPPPIDGMNPNDRKAFAKIASGWERIRKIKTIETETGNAYAFPEYPDEKQAGMWDDFDNAFLAKVRSAKR